MIRPYLLPLLVLVAVKLPAAAVSANPALGQDPASVDAGHPPGIAEMNFDSHGSRVNGLVYLANGPGPHPTVVLLHGLPGNEKNLDLAQTLRRDGFNVLFFHYRGAWGSEGTYSLTHQVEDVASATRTLHERAEEYRIDTSRIILLGHSVGGFTALRAAANDASIGCVAGIASANPAVWAAAFAADPESARGLASYADNLQMLTGLTGKKLVDEVISQADEFDVEALAPELSGKRVLLLAGDKDQVIPADFIHAPMVAAYEAREDITLTHQVLSGDHSFSWSRMRLMGAVLDWIQGCR